MPVRQLLQSMSGQEFGRWCAFLALQHEAANPPTESDQALASMFAAED